MERDILIAREIVLVIVLNFNLGICTVVKRHQMLGHIALYKYVIVIIIDIIIKVCLFRGQKELSRFQARLNPDLNCA